MREKVRRSFVTDLAGFRHLFIRQPVGFVTESTGSKPPKYIGFRFASENAKLAGLKSVQILRRWDQPCDARGANQWLEILDLHNTGLQTCINGLRQGFGGVRRCNCDPHRLCARCLEHAQVQHRNRSTHGEHTRRATSSHKLPDAQTYKL